MSLLEKFENFRQALPFNKEKPSSSSSKDTIFNFPKDTTFLNNNYLFFYIINPDGTINYPKSTSFDRDFVLNILVTEYINTTFRRFSSQCVRVFDEQEVIVIFLTKAIKWIEKHNNTKRNTTFENVRLPLGHIPTGRYTETLYGDINLEEFLAYLKTRDNLYALADIPGSDRKNRDHYDIVVWNDVTESLPITEYSPTEQAYFYLAEVKGLKEFKKLEEFEEFRNVKIGPVSYRNPNDILRRAENVKKEIEKQQSLYVHPEASSISSLHIFFIIVGVVIFIVISIVLYKGYEKRKSINPHAKYKIRK